MTSREILAKLREVVNELEQAPDTVQLREQNKQLKGILQTTEKDVEHFRQQALARCAEIDTLRATLLQKDEETKALREQHTAYKNKVFAQLYSPTPTTEGPYREQLEEISKLLAIYSNKARKAEEKANEFTAERQAAERQARLDTFAAAALVGSVSADGGADYPAEAEIAYNYAEAMETERDKRLAQTNPVKA